jgi:hypothetical protein
MNDPLRHFVRNGVKKNVRNRNDVRYCDCQYFRPWIIRAIPDPKKLRDLSRTDFKYSDNIRSRNHIRSRSEFKHVGDIRVRGGTWYYQEPGEAST